MTKKANREAARAYQEDKLLRERQEQHVKDVAEDLEQLRILRDYLIFKRKVRHFPHDALRHAIDDYVELLTGDRERLWSHPPDLCQGYRTPPE
jgi:hypothetical protein